MLAIDNDTVQASQGDDLGMSDRRDSDKSQQRFLLTSELVQES